MPVMDFVKIFFIFTKKTFFFQKLCLHCARYFDTVLRGWEHVSLQRRLISDVCGKTVAKSSVNNLINITI